MHMAKRLTATDTDRKSSCKPSSPENEWLNIVEKPFTAMVADMPDGFAIGKIITVSDNVSQLHFLEMNNAFRAQYGMVDGMHCRARDPLPGKAPSWLDDCVNTAVSGQPFITVHHEPAADRYFEMQGHSPTPGYFTIFSRDITSRKQGEQMLREREQQLWEMLSGLPGMVWVATADGQVNFVSPQWLAYTGIDHIGQRGSEWTNILHPADRETSFKAWRKAVTTGSAWNLECRLRRHDGQFHWFAWRGTPLRNAGGKIVRWFGVCTDINDLKSTEERLQESERRYSTLFANPTIAIAHYRIITNEQGQPVDYIIDKVNQPYERLTGLQKSEIEGKKITEVQPDIRQHPFDFIGNFGRIGLQGGDGIFEIQVSHIHHARWLSLYAYSPLPGECAVLYTDITDQKNASAALQESEEILRATFDQAAVGIAHISTHGHFMRVNRKFADMVGYSEDEIRGKHFLNLLPPDDAGTGLDDFRQMVEGRIPAFTVEKPYLRKDRSVLWIRITGSSVRDPQSDATKFNVAIIEDITSRKQAEQKHTQLMEQLRAAAIHADQGRGQLNAVFQSLCEGIAVFDMNANLIMLNARMAEISNFLSIDNMKQPLGYFAAHFEVSAPDGSIVPVEEWPVSRVLRGETITNWELQVRHLETGHTFYFSYSGAPVQDQQGRQVMSVVTTHDISERMRMEQARAESKRQLQLAVNIAQLGFWEWETATSHCYFSPTWKKQLGYQEHELPDALDEWHARLHPEDRHRVLLEIAQYLQQPSSDFRFEYRLLHRDGSYHWMIGNAMPAPGSTQEGIKLIGTQLDITDSKLAEQRLLQAAQHDPLTGLPNRALIFEYAGHLLAAAQRNHQQGALLFIDLDRFKPINDLYGHEIGDKLLLEVSRRLVQCVRTEDLVGRLGGDEFVVVLPHAGDVHPAAIVAQHVLEALSSPFTIEALDLSISASIGISHFPQHGTQIDALVNAADMAMYQAKQSGRGSFHEFTAAMTSRVNAASSIEARLKRALKHGGLSLHYQPVIDLQSRKIIGAEALLRLNGDNGEIIGPERFVPVAESAGLIAPIGEWVVTEACRQHLAWRSAGLPPISIAINVSPLQFRQRGFAQRLEDIIRESAMDPAWMQIEVTESSVMDSMEDAVATLNCIRMAGIRIALDDFGTGYSSLSHLSQLPLDKLKVDQSFVKRLEHDKPSRAIIEAIIALGRTLNLEVVGEGIESAEALAYLEQHGCNQAQGFYISQPLLALPFAKWYGEQHHQVFSR